MKHVPLHAFRRAAPKFKQAPARPLIQSGTSSPQRHIGAEQDLQAAADFSEYVYWVADTTGAGVALSHQWVALTGFRIDESLGKAGGRLSILTIICP
jgi:hypothetical protein